MLFRSNPGSVSIPKEGSTQSYVILEEESLVFKTINGEIYREESLPII